VSLCEFEEEEQKEEEELVPIAQALHLGFEA
jgi:hypothetical protein